MPWRILGFVSKTGRRDVDLWYAKQRPSVRAEFDSVLRFLRERDSWGAPDYKPLSGSHSGLGEFRFKADGVQWRPLGFFGPGVGEYTLLIGAYKKGRRWYPLEARDTAVARMAEVKSDATEIQVHLWAA